VTVTRRQVADGVEVAVSDMGAGIAAENLHRLLEPLHSTVTLRSKVHRPAVYYNSGAPHSEEFPAPP
jgi:hypothetical protein